MARRRKTYNDLMRLAKNYGVDKNAMFVQAVEQYEVQQRIITAIKETLDEDEEGLMTEKEYVKGRKNVYVNPLVKELPKHADSANRTLSTMLDIIEKFGKEPVQKGKLSMFDE